MHTTGIPTLYNGVQFRSRLEAKWACFFDLLKWKWEYEPYDMEGWIPDFVLFGKNQQILVEVKPIYELGEAEETLRKRMQKANNYQNEIILLGCSPDIKIQHSVSASTKEKRFVPLGWIAPAHCLKHVKGRGNQCTCPKEPMPWDYAQITSINDKEKIFSGFCNFTSYDSTSEWDDDDVLYHIDRINGKWLGYMDFFPCFSSLKSKLTESQERKVVWGAVNSFWKDASNTVQWKGKK